MGICSIIIYTVLFHLCLIVTSYLVPQIHCDQEKIDLVKSSVTTITCAYNESTVITKKIENLQNINYSGSLKHIIISDGSTDGTNDILRTIEGTNIQVICLPKNVGKTMCQNIAMELVQTDIAVFTDANTMLTSDTMNNLIRPFFDSRVGCTTGNIQLIEGSGFSFERLYWKFENRVKLAQSRLYSTVGATGGLYAIRTSLYRTMPAHILSDFIVPLTFAVRGYTTKFVPDAIAHELLGAQHIEKKRKKRILIRALQSLSYVRALLNPIRFPYFSWMIISHKILRWISPILICIAVIESMFLYPHVVFSGIVLYAIVAICIRIFLKNTRIYKVLAYLQTLFIANIYAWYRFFKKDIIVSWNVRQ